MKNTQTKFLKKVTRRIFAEDDYRNVFNLIFKDLKEFVPYDRIGLALVKHNLVVLEMVKTTYPSQTLSRGQSYPLKNTSLQKLAKSGKVRVINNLTTYFNRRKKTISDINRKILEEGILSSLTVPLKIKHNIFGFIFFSSRQTHVYKQADVDFLQETAELMAIALQKSVLITELKNSCSTLTKINRELIKANQLNDEVLSIAAHDIKNLIHPIKLSAEALLRRNTLTTDPRDMAYIQNIREVSQQLATLVSNILDISKIKKGKTTLEITDISPREILEGVLSSWKNQATRKKIQLRLQLLTTLPVTIRADEVKFAQIFNNLLSNAIKFTGENGKITITGKKDGDYYAFAVKDTGKGIVPKLLDTIFEQFQGSSQGTRGERGTGFGLSIVKQMIYIHQGKIDVKSKVGKGSTFTVYLPIR